MNLEIQPLRESNIEIIIQETEQKEAVKKEIPRLDREARRGNWTGSQFMKLMSSSQKGAKVDWFNKDKVYYFSDGALKYIFSNAMERKTGRYLLTDSTKEMKYGTKVEPLIRKRANAYLEKDKLFLEEVGFKTFPNIDTAGVSSDSVVKNEFDEIIASFESKACSSWTTLFERTYEKTNETSKDFWQTQGQMLAWEVDKNYYCVISPPQDINRYLYCEDIMELYDEWCAETEMYIEIIEKSPIHLERLEKRIQIAERVVERFLAGEEDNLKEVLYQEIDRFKQEQLEEDIVAETNKNINIVKEFITAETEGAEVDFEGVPFIPEKEVETPAEQVFHVEPDMDNLPF